LAPFSSPTTTTTGVFSTQAESEPACRRRRSPRCTSVSPHSLSRPLPLAVPPPRETRFGGRLALSRVHWVRPVLVAEITYLTWADDGLLRHTVFVDLRDDKPAREVRRERPT
jgi:ATP-dependent DNA ligase